jgi:hypothetical protein
MWHGPRQGFLQEWLRQNTHGSSTKSKERTAGERDNTQYVKLPKRHTKLSARCQTESKILQAPALAPRSSIGVQHPQDATPAMISADELLACYPCCCISVLLENTWCAMTQVQLDTKVNSIAVAHCMTKDTLSLVSHGHGQALPSLYRCRYDTNHQDQL